MLSATHISINFLLLYSIENRVLIRLFVVFLLFSLLLFIYAAYASSTFLRTKHTHTHTCDALTERIVITASKYAFENGCQKDV